LAENSTASRVITAATAAHAARLERRLARLGMETPRKRPSRSYPEKV
jgi:hypothetical protein